MRDVSLQRAACAGLGTVDIGMGCSWCVRRLLLLIVEKGKRPSITSRGVGRIARESLARFEAEELHVVASKTEKSGCKQVQNWDVADNQSKTGKVA